MRAIFVILSLFLAFHLHAQELSFMSFNIRYNSPNDGEDLWELRKGDVSGLLRYYQPSVLGLQEAVDEQLTFIDNELDGYAYVGVGRDDGDRAGEFSPILYDSATLLLLDHGVFWLSATPDEVSVGWDAALPRICTYALFRDKVADRAFWVFNTHFDHVGENARLNSAALIIKKINELNIGQNPVILMGDFNSQPDQNPIKLITNNLKDSYSESRVSYGPEGTFYGFDPNAIAENRIDYVFGKGVDFRSYRVIDDRRPNNRHVSDHLPVFVKAKLN